MTKYIEKCLSRANAEPQNAEFFLFLQFHASSSSKRKMSSICVPNSLAMAWASRMDGLYFPFSNEMMVWRETPSAAASCCCVMPRSFRFCSMIFFMLCSVLRKSSLLYIREHNTSSAKCQVSFTFLFCD